MALTVENGTGLSTAESYASVADVDTYHANRGNTTWADLLEVEKEQALRRATDHMVAIYRSRWKGSRVTATQALDWPRAWVKREDYYATTGLPPDGIDGEFYYPSDEVPAEVVKACAEMAVRASAGDLSPDLGRTTLEEAVGPIRVRYSDTSRESTKFKAIDDMLRLFLTGDGSSLKVVRV